MSEWVAEQFGVAVRDGQSTTGVGLEGLVRLALRRNPKRAHLLVSTVLGKHIPTDPRVVHGMGRLLGVVVRSVLDGGEVPAQVAAAAREVVAGWDPSALERADASGGQAVAVLGFAETATALGHCVADALGATWYLHSTRRPAPGVPVAGAFEEGHSHATSHLLQPIPASLLDQPGILVLVDDELSTGATAIGTIRELHRLCPRATYVVASLIDLRSPADRLRFEDLAAELGARILFASLATGSVELPDGLAGTVLERLGPGANGAAGDAAGACGAGAGGATRVELPWPADVPEGGRHGFARADRWRFEKALATAAGALEAALGPAPGRVLVLAHEELMYLPLRLACALAHQGRQVRYQTTTRSPVHPVDTPGYPIRRALRFPGTDGEGDRYVYNVGWSAPLGVPTAPGGDGADVVVLVVDGPAADPAALAPTVAALATVAPRVLVAVVPAVVPTPLPTPLHGPAFGSYAAQEVAWLLTDLSAVELEGEVAERERRIQAGTAHYAESLPVEYQPTDEYEELFAQVLAQTADRLATAVGVVTELVLAERGRGAVLVSLARAGTPVGVLMRRWAHQAHGLELPHYAVSIVRGKGIDTLALQYLARHHDPADIVFVDGWTGKGAIAKELTAALDEVAAAGGPRFNDDLAVLADPGVCVRTYGTRDDFLIPSACLNSTVSGLVSRTVLNADYTGPRDFHGAKFYAELAGRDRSRTLLDAVSARFDAVRGAVADQAPQVAAGDRSPTWAGWAAVEKVQRSYGVSSVNFVKPGVGETTRVLLRRIPWRVLVRSLEDPDHLHIRLLADQRGVPVEVVPDLPYSCIGLIKELD